MKTTLHTLLIFIISGTILYGQTIETFATGFGSPIDVNHDSDGYLWVAAGGSGMDDGQVVRVSEDGTKEIIVQDLPSSVNGNGSIEGVLSILKMPDGRIYICQGVGSNALSASIIEFHMDDFITKGEALTLDDRRSIVMVGEWALSNGYAESNPYSFLINANGDFIIADAAANAIFKYSVGTQSLSTLTDLAPFANPTPVGPPMVEAVPTKILAHPDGGYLVSYLTGFPFPVGSASIYRVMDDGTTSIFASGLTLLTDMAYDPADNELVALQFARVGPTFNFIPASARLIKVYENGSKDTIVQSFGPSAGLTIVDDGTIYMTDLFSGQLIKSDHLISSLFNIGSKYTQKLSVYPNPNGGQFTMDVNLNSFSDVRYQLTDFLGRRIQEGKLQNLQPGDNEIWLDISGHNLSHGHYQINLFSEHEYFNAKIVIR